MNRKKKRYLKSNIKSEDREAEEYDTRFAGIIKRFNKFLFEGGKGSFIQFDIEYRKLACQPWKFIRPDVDYFTQYAILR